MYKIRNKETGLFSAGGDRPTFTKNGKFWNKIGHLKSHLTHVDGYNKMYHKDVYENCEIVEYEFNEIGTKEIVYKNN